MYITVLDSDLKKDPWLAIQWDNSLDILRTKTNYNPAVDKNFPKNEGDKKVQGITVTDNTTGATPTATIIQLVPVMTTMADTRIAGTPRKQKAKKAPKKKSVTKGAAAKKSVSKKKAAAKKQGKPTQKKKSSKK